MAAFRASRDMVVGGMWRPAKMPDALILFLAMTAWASRQCMVAGRWL